MISIDAFPEYVRRVRIPAVFYVVAHDSVEAQGVFNSIAARARSANAEVKAVHINVVSGGGGPAAWQSSCSS